MPNLRFVELRVSPTAQICFEGFAPLDPVVPHEMIEVCSSARTFVPVNLGVVVFDKLAECVPTSDRG